MEIKDWLIDWGSLLVWTGGWPGGRVGGFGGMETKTNISQSWSWSWGWAWQYSRPQKLSLPSKGGSKNPQLWWPLEFFFAKDEAINNFYHDEEHTALDIIMLFSIFFKATLTKLSLSVQLELGTSWANEIKAGWWMTILWMIGACPSWNYLAMEEPALDSLLCLETSKKFSVGGGWWQTWKKL